MGYTRSIITLPYGERIFMKQHDNAHFSDPIRAEHSRNYLVKEAWLYQQASGIEHLLPAHTQLAESTLLLEAFDERDGWHWRVPAEPNQRRQYIEHVLTALKELETHEIIEHEQVSPSLDIYHGEGWRRYPASAQRIKHTLAISKLEGSNELARALDGLYEQFTQQTDDPRVVFSHHDMRQSNIAWHPEAGVRFIDWSWSGHGTRGADATMFIIDLAKSGVDVRDYMDVFDDNHARTLIGFWLEHSTWPTPTEDKRVRTQQLRSAIAAYNTIKATSRGGEE